jgi:hypothetical protein
MKDVRRSGEPDIYAYFDDSRERQSSLEALIDEYSDISDDCLPAPTVYPPEDKNNCKTCGVRLEQNNADHDCSRFVCMECGINLSMTNTVHSCE